MSILTDSLGMSEERAIRICKDVDDMLRPGGPRHHNIPQELKILAGQYSGNDLAFAGYVYGRKIQALSDVFASMGLNVEIHDGVLKR